MTIEKSATAEQSIATLEPPAPADGPKSPVAGEQKRERRKTAARRSRAALSMLDKHLPKTTAREEKRGVGLIRRPTTEALVEANRANSLKSTGPVTDLGKVNARLNAVKHGIFSPAGVTLPELGEFFGDLKHIMEQIRKCFPALDDFELILQNQMVENRWRRRRALKAEASVLIAQRRQFELDYGQKLAGEGRSPDATGEARLAAASGLVALPDSSAKFNLILQLLRAAQESVRQDGFSEEGLKRLETVYGPDPGLAGAILLSSYRQRRENGNQGAQDAASDTSSQQAFLDMLAAEIACFEKLLELHERTAAEVAEANAGAQSALSPSDTQRFTRYETFLDRQFERLVKQFNEHRREQRV
jgi:hypothetical protein